MVIDYDISSLIVRNAMQRILCYFIVFLSFFFFLCRIANTVDSYCTEILESNLEPLKY